MRMSSARKYIECVKNASIRKAALHDSGTPGDWRKIGRVYSRKKEELVYFPKFESKK